MSDDDFEEKVLKLMNSMWIKQLTLDELSNQFAVTPQFIRCFVNLSRTLMNGLQRRQYSEEKLKNLFLENGLSNSSADVLLNTFQINTKFWFDMLVFTNTQDTTFELRALRQENKEILKTLKDLLKILKEGKDPSEPRHFQ